MISVSCNFGGVDQTLSIAAKSLTDIAEPLARYGGYLRGQAKARIDAGEFAPLAPSTMKRKLTHAGLALRVVSKGGRSVFRTIVKMDRQQSRALHIGEFGKSAKGRTKAIERAKVHGESLAAIQRTLGAAAGYMSTDALLKAAEHEIARAKYHGINLRASRVLTKGSPERIRQAARGKARYRAEEGSTEIIGGLRNTMHVIIDKKRLAVMSHVRWSGVHNHGGEAGHGAKIPERRFLVIARLDMLVRFLVEHGTEAFLG